MIRKAFTMIELVFVIIVIGILAAVSIPKISGVQEDACVANATGTILAINSAISSERQRRIFRGQSNYINHIDKHSATSVSDGSVLFDNNGTNNLHRLLATGVKSGTDICEWKKTATDTYVFKAGATANVKFKYDSTTGKFTCDGFNSGEADDICQINFVN